MCTLGWIRTSDRSFRKRKLYPLSYERMSCQVTMRENLPQTFGRLILKRCQVPPGVIETPTTKVIVRSDALCPLSYGGMRYSESRRSPVTDISASIDALFGTASDPSFNRETFLKSLAAAAGNPESLVRLQYEMLSHFAKFLPEQPVKVDPDVLKARYAAILAYVLDPANEPQREDENSRVADVACPLSGAILADAFALIECEDQRVTHVLINARDYADLRKFGRDFFGEPGHEDVVWGLRSILFGAGVVTSRLVPAGKVYLLGETEKGEFGHVAVIHVTR